MRRLLAVVLTAVLFCLMPLPAAAADGWSFDLVGNVLLISGTGELPARCYTGDPDAVSGVILQEGVTGIQSNALAEFSRLQSVNLPESCHRLAPRALYGLSSLGVILGLDHVTEFGYRCLSGTGYAAQEPFVIRSGQLYYAECTDLMIPDGVTEIMPFAFGNLTDPALASSRVRITLPEGLRVIRENAFAFCTPLTAVELPGSLESIGDHAFYCCPHLRSTVLPSGVESIGEQAFFNCRSLSVLTLKNPAAVLGADACGQSYDWEQAVRSREGNYPGNYEQALMNAMIDPAGYDRQLTQFALHEPSDRDYAEIGFAAELSVPYLMQTGSLRAYAGTPAEAFAAENGIPFVPLDILPGDVNLDGAVDILDVILLNKYLIGVAVLSAPSRTAADMAADAELSGSDSIAILRRILGM